MRLTKSNHFSLSAKILLLLVSLTASSLVIAVESWAVAQPLPPSPRPPKAAPASSQFGGIVEQYLLNPEGVVDGLLLRNGLEVKFPPHMANRLTVVVKPGDRVEVTGVPGIPSEFGQEIRAFSITNTSTEKTVSDQPPAEPPQPPLANRENLSVEGKAQQWLVGGRGEINGILLSSGAQVKFPPHVGYQLSNLARKGATIQAQGFGSRSPYGQVLEATSLTVDGQTIPLQAPIPSKPLPQPR